MSIFGLIMFVLAFFLWKKYKKIKNLIENGLSIQAKITAIEESSYNENSKVSYDYLVATYKDHVFESAEFPSRISALLKPGDEVRVYIDPLDHKNYWVDIDQLQEDLNQKISTPQISTVDSQIPPQSS